ncbi:D-alanyl-D-alanine carboxypeptidase family protein [Clostridium oceanicum]|uniref:D-alanyl-D-alanine carboxypeptidase family protein n=1 Tax=Clostridium oceanicum TaxID=1543 RepID=A0ABP3UV45_9CLOT
MKIKQKTLTIITVLFLLFTFNSNILAASSNNNAQPNIYGKSAITIDVKTGEIIYAKNVDKTMYPASTTKLLTALLFAENKNKNDDITYTDSAKKQPAFSLNTSLHAIKVGETIKASDVMDGLLLYSGNDVAYMIADSVSGNSKKFEDAMNKKIHSFGLKNTHFVTPNGLHNKEHYTTAYDLSVISRKAFENPWVYESSHKKKSSVTTSTGTKMLIENRNKLLQKHGEEDAAAGKTGYTSQAGRCLVSLFNRNGRKILGVVLGSVYDAKDSFVFNDMEKIIDWSYSAKKTSLYKKGSKINKKDISYKPLGFGPSIKLTVPLESKDDISYYKNDVNSKELKKSINLTSVSRSSLLGKKEIGTLSLTERESKNNYKLYSSLSSSELNKKCLPIYLGAGILIIIVIILIILLMKFISFLKRRRRRKRNRYW